MSSSHIFGLLWWFWLNWFWVVAFPVTTYLSLMHARRMMRGKIHRFLLRHWGLQGLLFVRSVLWSLIILALVFYVVGQHAVTDYTLAMYWTISCGWSVIDYITGGDDPGRRVKRFASAFVKKLKVAPAPRPAIDLRMNT